MESLTLEQAYYIGELIAAAVVVLSLLFVAQQLRQNTSAIKSQALESAIQIAQSEVLKLGNDEFAQVFRKSISVPEKLSPNEIQQLDAWNMLLLMGRSNDYQLYKLGTLSEARFYAHEPTIKYALSSKWHRNWLKVGGRHFFDDEFIDWVEGIADKSDFDLNAYYESLALKE